MTTTLCAPVSTKTTENEKFVLFVDLGIITVPDDYMHKSRLTTFYGLNQDRFLLYQDEITDVNFPYPSRILKPGNKFRLRAFREIVPGRTTLNMRLGFLATQKAIYTGAQGLSLVFDQKRDQLPRAKWYVSFDVKERLLAQDHNYHGVPLLGVRGDGAFLLTLDHFECLSGNNNIFLCFTEMKGTS